jgi:hypothetical protein
LGKASFNDEFKLNPVVQITGKISPCPIATVFLILRPPPIQAEILRFPAGGYGGSAPPLPRNSFHVGRLVATR